MSTSKERIEVYNELRESLNGDLETQYSYLMTTGNVDEAYKTFLRLMDYGFINYGDERANPKTKMFKTKEHLIDCTKSSNWATRDFRREVGVSYVPKQIIGDFNFQYALLEESLGHWGKRVEGNYEGDIYMDKTPRKVLVKMLTTKKAVKNAIDDIKNICKKRSISPKGMDDILDEALLGMDTIYEVTVDGNVMNGYKTLGYVVYRLASDGCSYNGFTIMRYKEAAEIWLNIQYLNSDILKMASECLCSVAPVNKVSEIIKPDEGFSLQNILVEASKVKGPKPEKK